MRAFLIIATIAVWAIILGCKLDPKAKSPSEKSTFAVPRFTLIPTDTFYFNNFVDCNMAEAMDWRYIPHFSRKI